MTFFHPFFAPPIFFFEMFSGAIKACPPPKNTIEKGKWWAGDAWHLGIDF